MTDHSKILVGQIGGIKKNQTMNFREIGFSIPLLPILLAVMLSLLICTIVPVLTWMIFEKNESIVERIKGVE